MVPPSWDVFVQKYYKNVSIFKVLQLNDYMSSIISWMKMRLPFCMSFMSNTWDLKSWLYAIARNGPQTINKSISVASILKHTIIKKVHYVNIGGRKMLHLVTVIIKVKVCHCPIKSSSPQQFENDLNVK